MAAKFSQIKELKWIHHMITPRSQDARQTCCWKLFTRVCIFQLLFPPWGCQLVKLSHLRNLPPQKLLLEFQHLLDLCKSIEIGCYWKSTFGPIYVQICTIRYDRELLSISILFFYITLYFNLTGAEWKVECNNVILCWYTGPLGWAWSSHLVQAM